MAWLDGVAVIVVDEAGGRTVLLAVVLVTTVDAPLLGKFCTTPPLRTEPLVT